MGIKQKVNHTVIVSGFNKLTSSTVNCNCKLPFCAFVTTFVQTSIPFLNLHHITCTHVKFTKAKKKYKLYHINYFSSNTVLSFSFILCFKQLYILTGTHTDVCNVCYCFYTWQWFSIPEDWQKRSKCRYMKATVIETTYSCRNFLHKIGLYGQWSILFQ